nr:probable methyltransferase PMT2 [Tanacetum cinerariifolium]
MLEVYLMKLDLIQALIERCHSSSSSGLGVNYRVVGATVLNTSILEAREILNPFVKRIVRSSITMAKTIRRTRGNANSNSDESYETYLTFRIEHVIKRGYRNIVDMNAGLGGFAAALDSSKLWVMNIVLTLAETNTLGVIYERGLISIYHEWCEAVSTYPCVYDLIHANSLFSLYNEGCNFKDIHLEMDRMLWPEGAVMLCQRS